MGRNAIVESAQLRKEGGEVFRDGLFRALVARWYVMAFGLGLTAALCFQVVQLVPPTYEARADVLLLPPRTKPGDNPYLGLGGLREVTEVLSRSLDDDATVNSLLPADTSTTYTVDRDFTVDSPIVLVVGDDKTAAGSMDIMTRVTQLLPSRLAQIQRESGASTGSLVTSTVVKIDLKPKVVRNTQVRAIIAGGAIGLFLTLFLVAAAERLIRTRAARRRPGPDPSPPDDTTLAEEPTGAPDAALRRASAANEGPGGTAYERASPRGNVNDDGSLDDQADDRSAQEDEADEQQGSRPDPVRQPKRRPEPSGRR